MISVLSALSVCAASQTSSSLPSSIAFRSCDTCSFIAVCSYDYSAVRGLFGLRERVENPVHVAARPFSTQQSTISIDSSTSAFVLLTSYLNVRLCLKYEGRRSTYELRNLLTLSTSYFVLHSYSQGIKPNASLHSRSLSFAREYSNERLGAVLNATTTAVLDLQPALDHITETYVLGHSTFAKWNVGSIFGWLSAAYQPDEYA